jgi:hypothetical protein
MIAVGTFGPDKNKAVGRPIWKLVDEALGEEVDVSSSFCIPVKSRSMRRTADADKEEWDIIDDEVPKPSLLEKADSSDVVCYSRINSLTPPSKKKFSSATKGFEADCLLAVFHSQNVLVRVRLPLSTGNPEPERARDNTHYQSPLYTCSLESYVKSTHVKTHTERTKLTSRKPRSRDCPTVQEEVSCLGTAVDKKNSRENRRMSGPPISDPVVDRSVSCTVSNQSDTFFTIEARRSGRLNRNVSFGSLELKPDLYFKNLNSESDAKRDRIRRCNVTGKVLKIARIGLKG